MCVILADTKQDTIAIHPSDFGVPPEQAVTSELNKKYTNRVLFDDGPYICVFDAVEAEEDKN
jgi:DNA-directed RNA polymerase III subunit RPC8